MNLRAIVLALIGAFLVGSLGYAATIHAALERTQGKDGANIYKNNFLGMKITTPAMITTRVPVSAFERAPGDRMFFNSTEGVRIINIILHYNEFDKNSYVHTVTSLSGHQDIFKVDIEEEKISGNDFFCTLSLPSTVRRGNIVLYTRSETSTSSFLFLISRKI